MKRLCIFLLLCTFPLFAQYEVGERNPGVAALAAIPSDFASGMVEAWPMNEGSGTIMYTVSGSGDNLTSTSGSWVSGPTYGYPSGSVASFNGSTSRANGANQTNTNFTGATPFSFCAWINPNSAAISAPTAVVISTLLTSPSYAGWEFSMDHGKLSAYVVSNNSTGNQILVQATGLLTAGTLQMVCFTYDGSKAASGIKIYVDGTAVTTSVATDGLTGSAVNSNPVAFGARPLPTSTFYSGTIGYATLWGVQKTPTQIANYYALGPAVP